MNCGVQMATLALLPLRLCVVAMCSEAFCKPKSGSEKSVQETANVAWARTVHAVPRSAYNFDKRLGAQC